MRIFTILLIAIAFLVPLTYLNAQTDTGDTPAEEEQVARITDKVHSIDNRAQNILEHLNSIANRIEEYIVNFETDHNTELTDARQRLEEGRELLAQASQDLDHAIEEIDRLLLEGLSSFRANVDRLKSDLREMIDNVHAARSAFLDAVEILKEEKAKLPSTDETSGPVASSGGSGNPLVYLEFENTLGPKTPKESENITYDTGIVGSGAKLSKQSSLAYSSGIENFNKNSGTFELWLKPGNWKNGGQVIHRLFDARFICSGCQSYMILDVDTYNQKILFKINDKNSDEEKTAAYSYDGYDELNLLAWHHIAVTWHKRHGTKLYLDGKLVASNNDPFDLGTPRSNLQFATSENVELVGKVSPDGTIDELKIYDYPRSTSQIQKTYKDTAVPDYSFETKDTSLGFRMKSGRIVDSLLSQADGFISGQDGGTTLAFKGGILWLFDDTNLKDASQFLSNNVAYTADLNARDGIRLNFVTDNQGRAKQVLNPKTGESTIWPNTLVNIDGVIYTYYSSVKSDPVLWFYPVEDGWAKTPTVVNDPEDITFVRTNAVWPAVNKKGTGPGMPVLHEGGYIYHAKSDGNNKGLFLARVHENSIEDTGAYTWWNGNSWVTDESKAKDLIDAPYETGSSGFLLDYNEYLGKWLMIHSSSPILSKIVARTADNITGPWSPAKVLVHCTNELFSCYQGYWHSEYDKNGGQTIYLTATNWNRYQKAILELELEKI